MLAFNCLVEFKKSQGVWESQREQERDVRREFFSSPLALAFTHLVFRPNSYMDLKGWY